MRYPEEAICVARDITRSRQRRRRRTLYSAIWIIDERTAPVAEPESRRMDAVKAAT